MWPNCKKTCTGIFAAGWDAQLLHSLSEREVLEERINLDTSRELV